MRSGLHAAGGRGGGVQGTFLTCREAAGRVRKGWGPGPQELHGLMPRNLAGGGGKDGKGDSRREKPGSDCRDGAQCRLPPAWRGQVEGAWPLGPEGGAQARVLGLPALHPGGIWSGPTGLPAPKLPICPT